MRVTRLLSALLTAMLAPLLLTSTVRSQTGEQEQAIRNGSLVGIEYTLLDDQGKKIESNKGRDPFTYTHGNGQIIQGLETGLEGMRVGQEKVIRVKPEDAYGQINPGAFKEVPRENIPPELVKPGATLVVRNPQGLSFPVRVHEIKEKTVILDLNHPLAGKTLIFEVRILTVQPAPNK